MSPFTGERLVQKDLARTLGSIARHGVDGFFRGAVAAALVEASRTGGGIITRADLEQYRALERATLECSYRGFVVVAAPPPSSGGVTLCEMLNILDGYPLASLGHGSAQAVHYQIEAMRHAYADRNAYLGDPQFVDNPLERLLDKQYAAQIRRTIDPRKAGVSAALRSYLLAVRHLLDGCGLNLSDERKEEVNLRFIPKMLARLAALDDRPLALPRDPDRKLVGNCRDHSLLLCSILRHQGLPARARCGFGAYFMPNHYEDHWVGEYWERGSTALGPG